MENFFLVPIIWYQSKEKNIPDQSSNRPRGYWPSQPIKNGKQQQPLMFHKRDPEMKENPRSKDFETKEPINVWIWFSMKFQWEREKKIPTGKTEFPLEKFHSKLDREKKIENFLTNVNNEL